MTNKKSCVVYQYSDIMLPMTLTS